MIPIKIESAWKGTSDCRNCGVRDMVLFADLNEQDFGEIHTPIDDMVFSADAPLYTEGETALGVFTLRKGMIKLVRATVDGRERIVRVLRPGDVAGLEALANARYDTEAIVVSLPAFAQTPDAKVAASLEGRRRLAGGLELWLCPTTGGGIGPENAGR
jgi:hypothetical protein